MSAQGPAIRAGQETCCWGCCSNHRRRQAAHILLAASLFVPCADVLSCTATTRLRIPLEEYPGYNFIGLIIGPRGNTHRRLEQVRLQDRLQDRRQHAGRWQHAASAVSARRAIAAACDGALGL